MTIEGNPPFILRNNAPRLFPSITIEPEKFTPSETVRPHHITLFGEVRDVIAGDRTPQSAARRIISELADARKGADPTGYYKDSAEATDEGIQRQIEKETAYFRRLQNLPDTAYIHLDLTPDGICATCPIGKHCRGTQYASSLDPRPTEVSEKDCLSTIRHRLQRQNFREGIDFIIVPTTHTLYHYGGRKLSDSTPGISQKVIFDSMIVSKGALRQVCEVWDEYRW